MVAELRIVLIITSFFILQNFFAQGIEIPASGSIESIGNTSIEITDGNFMNSGTYIIGTGNLIFSGSSYGSILGSSNNDFYHLTINNSNGVSLLSTGYNVINDMLTFSNGLLNTNTNYITINDNAIITGNNMIKYINGNCRKVGNDAFLFPIGNNGKYAPIAITAPTSISDHFTASYYNQNPNPLYNVSLLAPSIYNVSSIEYWALDRTNGTSDVNVSLYWDTASGVNNLVDLSVVRWDGSLWTDEGNAGTTGNTSSGSIISNVVTNFNLFTLGSVSSSNPLPVELVAFNAKCVDGTTQINWTTASEINCDYYLVEKMDNENSFATIGRVQGNGNSNQPINYKFEDNNSNQISYYRLTQVDFDGEAHTYNDKITVSICEDGNFQMDLNGNINEVNIVVNASIENVLIKIYNLNGALIFSSSTSLSYGNNKIDFTNYNLATGMYLINVHTEQKEKSTKLIIK